jgi:rhomboid protease GluP
MSDSPESQDNHPSQDGFYREPPVQPPPPQQVRIKLPDNKPYVVYIIMGITILVYLLQMGANWIVGYDLVAIYGMKINEYIYQGEYWRLITPVFLHGSLTHIGFNMYALYALGPQMERFYGSWQFLLLYLVSGFGGVVASFALTEAPSVGASTAIFGLLGAYGIFSYMNQKVQIAAINLLIGMTPGIDNWGHMGGLVAGVIIAWFGGPQFDLVRDELSIKAKNVRTDDQFLLAILIALLIFGAIAGYLIFVY